MKIKLYYNSSENNVIGKTLSEVIELDGNLRDSSDITNPVIMITSDTKPNANYAYIDNFNRFYFISEITAYRSNSFILKLKVDVLESYKEQIKQLKVVLSGTENTGKSMYLNSDIWIRNVKDKTDIITFPNGLSENGEFILITAGG